MLLDESIFERKCHWTNPNLDQTVRSQSWVRMKIFENMTTAQRKDIESVRGIVPGDVVRRLVVGTMARQIFGLSGNLVKPRPFCTVGAASQNVQRTSNLCVLLFLEIKTPKPPTQLHEKPHEIEQRFEIKVGRWKNKQILVVQGKGDPKQGSRASQTWGVQGLGNPGPGQMWFWPKSSSSLRHSCTASTKLT